MLARYHANININKLDKERQTYGMKETNLGKYYVQILNIAETSGDAKRLLHWRKPTADTVKTINNKRNNYMIII